MKTTTALALAIIAATASAATAQPRPAQQLPIQQGNYVADFESCGETMSVFRYDGRRIGWFGAERQAHEMEAIRSVRRQGRSYRVEIADRDSGSGSGGVTPVIITPRGQGRIAVEVQEEIAMRLCAPATLPRWMRGR